MRDLLDGCWRFKDRPRRVNADFSGAVILLMDNAVVPAPGVNVNAPATAARIPDEFDLNGLQGFHSVRLRLHGYAPCLIGKFVVHQVRPVDDSFGKFIELTRIELSDPFDLIFSERQ